MLYLRFVLLQPVEGCQPLTFVDWDSDSTLETLEIRQSTMETLETLETIALLESPSPLLQA